MARFVLRDVRVGVVGRRVAAVAEARVRAGVVDGAVVCVDDVAGGAARLSVVAGRVVRAHEGHDGVVESSFLRAEDDGVNARLRAVAAVTQTDVGLSGHVLAVRVSEFRLWAAAALERTPEGDAQGLPDFKTWEGEEEGEYAFLFGLLLGRRRDCARDLRLARRAVVLADDCVLRGERAVVVERGRVDLRAVRHRALLKAFNIR